MRQNRVDNSLLPMELLHQRVMFPILILIPFLNSRWLIDETKLITVSFLMLGSKDVLLVEGPGPPLWDAILDLVLHGDLIWGPC
jgi:hypothetical protein